MGKGRGLIPLSHQVLPLHGLYIVNATLALNWYSVRVFLILKWWYINKFGGRKEEKNVHIMHETCGKRGFGGYYGLTWIPQCNIIWFHSWNNYMQYMYVSLPPGKIFAPEMQKRAPENCHRLQCKSLFNVAELVNGMWKVAPENKNFIFGLSATTLRGSLEVYFTLKIVVRDG